jgi:hypothetical protein
MIKTFLEKYLDYLQEEPELEQEAEMLFTKQPSAQTLNAIDSIRERHKKEREEAKMRNEKWLQAFKARRQNT